MEVEYHKIPVKDTYYLIGSDGSIKNSNGMKMAPFKTKNGYMKINLLKKGFYMHRLVAECFIPNPEEKPQVNHKNGDKTDNRVENLEWVTNSENMLHCIRTNNVTRRSNVEIMEVNSMNKFSSIAEASRHFNINYSTICKSIRENRKTKDGKRFIEL